MSDRLKRLYIAVLLLFLMSVVFASFAKTRAFRRIAGARGEAWLLHLLKHNSLLFPRRQAALMLGQLRAYSAIPSLIEALEDGDPHLRAMSAQALAQLGAVAAMPHLERMLERESEPGVKQIALQSLRLLQTIG